MEGDNGILEGGRAGKINAEVKLMRMNLLIYLWCSFAYSVTALPYVAPKEHL